MNYLLVVQVFVRTPYLVLPGQFSVKINKQAYRSGLYPLESARVLRFS